MVGQQEFYTGKDQIEFSQIVLSHVSKILEILSKELRFRKNIIPQSNARAEIIVEEEDSRISFCQSVEGLSTILTPWFNKDCKESFVKFDLIVNGLRTEYYKEYQKELEEEFEEQKKLKINSYLEVNNDFIRSYRIYHKVTTAKKMFIQLNILLHENEYLKSSVYGEKGKQDAE